MYYLTVMQSPKYHQMTIEELLEMEDDIFSEKDYVITSNITNTRTFEVKSIKKKWHRYVNPFRLSSILLNFNEKYKELREVDRHELYREFYIPKKSGGLRKIDAPNDALMTALRELKTIFENDFKALYHTSAFAYVKHRSTIDAVKRHQQNESKWFGKFDLSNFFGSTTLEFTMKMLEKIFPFCELSSLGKQYLRTALELAFLDGGLPQGTPISPLITNLIMIPIDFELTRRFRDFNHQHFIYTRYADDFLISSRYDFKFKDVEKEICDVLAQFEAPFTIKPEKTRYGSSAGSNWNLGVMLNKDNQITVGHKKKRQFKAMLSSYIMDKINGKEWDLNDIQVMEGYRNYFKMVEGKTIDDLVKHIGDKFNVDPVALIKQDLKQNG